MSDLVTIPLERPHGYDGMLARFGDPGLRQVQGVWVVDPSWEARSLVTFYHPILPHAPELAAGRIYIHRLVVEPFARLLNRWALRQAAGDRYRIRHIGAFCPRLKRGLGEPSTHTWAVAFDLNPDQNPLVICDEGDPRRSIPYDPRRNIGHDIPESWFEDALLEGWVLGRDFKHRHDPQHFQFCDGI